MTRPNFSSRSRQQITGKHMAGGTLLGLFLGLVVGVLGAAAIVFYLNKTPAPFKSATQTPPAQPQPAPAASQKPGEAPVTPAPMALPGKPGDPIPQADKPRFDFYKILPGNAEAVPDPKPDAKVSDKKDNLLKDPVYLQAGSFQNPGDADNQKARLAMMGNEAAIQQVMLQEKVWYRVRLGPFNKMEDVSRVRADLAKQGIEAAVVKKD